MPDAAEPGQFTGPTTVVQHESRTVKMHQVTREELSTLRGVGPTLSVAFLSLTVGAWLSFNTTLDTVDLTPADRDRYGTYRTMCFLLMVFFLAFAVLGYWKLYRTVSDIRRRTRAKRLLIKNATWGAGTARVDVTDIVSAVVFEGSMEFHASVDTLGCDPVPGVVKNLRITYTTGWWEKKLGREKTYVATEGRTAVLP